MSENPADEAIAGSTIALGRRAGARGRGRGHRGTKPPALRWRPAAAPSRQGYLFSRPIPADAFMEWLEARDQRAAYVAAAPETA